MDNGKYYKRYSDQIKLKKRNMADQSVYEIMRL